MRAATHDHPLRGRFHAWFLSATEAAGLSRVELEAFRVRSPFFQVAPHVAGVAFE